MYNEKDDQIFNQLDANKEPVEFLIDKQPLEFIRAGIVTKDEIRETVEDGVQEDNIYAKTFVMQDYIIAMTVFVRIVESVEKLYF